MLKTRIITASLLVPLILAGLFVFPPAGWLALVTLIVSLGAWEWTRLAALSAPMRWIYPLVTAPLFVLLVYVLPITSLFGLMLGGSLFWLLLAPLWLRARWSLAKAGPTSVLLGWALLMPAGLAMWLLHNDVRGGWVLLSVLAIAWIADTAAYFSGKAFGRHKLAPAISPGKSWEGAAGGMLAVLVYVAVLPKSLFPQAANLPLWGWLLLAAVLTAVSIVGDLLESLFKRQAGIKDSSNLLPGHGGVLDRVDSQLAILPVATACYLYPLLFAVPV
ncbi:phosphatidate cytidylyltransferase [Andreprevotia lacus DSM 23236]|jgi:phosphatidate cytidylyltransferase|uniref:Phosphatidate cytidylyltransferase n=1 Tax=Andreprevotia lacus DSM 23236 TaxID=1121001 RepID=A0A1W1XLK9_9NEIS|nr:phosphatidate cytidylyltransferase [Andreprevotia lacus]SMC24752.1 phosphatidate cytidylyltransferase [Andreprevotia lacus DSM 23236]